MPDQDQLKRGGDCLKAANAVTAYVCRRDFSIETVQVTGDRHKIACYTKFETKANINKTIVMQ